MIRCKAGTAPKLSARIRPAARIASGSGLRSTAVRVCDPLGKSLATTPAPGAERESERDWIGISFRFDRFASLAKTSCRSGSEMHLFR